MGPDNSLTQSVGYSSLSYTLSITQAARVWAVLDVFAITLAVAMFIVETIPEIKRDIESDEPNLRKTTFFIIETGCIIFFTIELLARFVSCPRKFVFLRTAMNWIDFVTILPYYIQVVRRYYYL